MRSALSILVLAFALAFQASAASRSIDDFISSEMPSAGAPGLAYAVVEGGEINAGAHGEVLLGSGVPITPDTPFLIGSITKSFTAMAVMQLAEAGVVDLDAEISRYLDEFADQPSGSITIRQLLNHTSGYSTLQGNQSHTDSTQGEDELARHVKRIARFTPVHEPGARWDYSNANYQILGAIIEAVSGQDYARYVESEILEPIGMENSFVADGKDYDAMAVGHRPWFGSKRPMKERRPHRVTAPAGGVIASANDMARYITIMMNGEDDIISAASKAAMMAPASPASPNYGLGWVIDGENGIVYHTGTSPGVETLATLIPAQQKGVVVLINAGSGMGFGETTDLFNGVSARALGLDYAEDQGQWSRKLLFLTFALAPLLFVFAAITAIVRRAGLRAKSGLFGAFSLWFPMVMTLALAWTVLYLIPQLFGVTAKTLHLYQPDLVLAMIATAATGVFWSVVRLGVYYGGRK